jgi:hypothetical protein
MARGGLNPAFLSHSRKPSFPPFIWRLEGMSMTGPTSKLPLRNVAHLLAKLRLDQRRSSTIQLCHNPVVRSWLNQFLGDYCLSLDIPMHLHTCLFLSGREAILYHFGLTASMGWLKTFTRDAKNKLLHHDPMSTLNDIDCNMK